MRAKLHPISDFRALPDEERQNSDFLFGGADAILHEDHYAEGKYLVVGFRQEILRSSGLGIRGNRLGLLVERPSGAFGVIHLIQNYRDGDIVKLERGGTMALRRPLSASLAERNFRRQQEAMADIYHARSFADRPNSVEELQRLLAPLRLTA